MKRYQATQLAVFLCVVFAVTFFFAAGHVPGFGFAAVALGATIGVFLAERRYNAQIQ